MRSRLLWERHLMVVLFWCFCLLPGAEGSQVASVWEAILHMRAVRVVYECERL